MTGRFRFGLRRPFYFDQGGTESSVKSSQSSNAVVGKEASGEDPDVKSGFGKTQKAGEAVDDANPESSKAGDGKPDNGDKNGAAETYPVSAHVNGYIDYMTDSFIGSLHHLIMDDRKQTADDNDKMYKDARNRYKDFYRFAKDHSIDKKKYQEEDYNKYGIPKDWKKTEEEIPNMNQKDINSLLKVYRKVQIQDFKFTVHTGQDNKIPDFNKLYDALYYLALFCSLVKSDTKWLDKKLKCGTFGDHTFEEMYNITYDLLQVVHLKLFNTKELGFDKINIKDNDKAEKPEEGPTEVTAAAEEVEPESSKGDGKDENGATFKWYEAAKKKFESVCEAQKKNKSPVWTALTQSIVYNVLSKLFTDSSLYKKLDNYKKAAPGTKSSVNKCYQEVFQGNHRRVGQENILKYYQVSYNLDEKDKSNEDPSLSKHWVGEHAQGRKEHRAAYDVIEETRKLVDKSIKEFFKTNDQDIGDKWKIQATIVWYLTYLLAKLANSEDTEVEDGKTADEKLAADWLNKMYRAFKTGNIKYNNEPLNFQKDNSKCQLYEWLCQDDISSVQEMTIKTINHAYPAILNPGRKTKSKDWENNLQKLLGQTAVNVLSIETGLYSGGDPTKTDYPYTKGLAAINDYMDDLYTAYEKIEDTGIDKSNSDLAYKAFSLYVLLCQKYSGWAEKDAMDAAFYHVFNKRLTFKNDGSIFLNSRRGREVRALT